MSRKQIKVEEVKNYSFEELTNTKYTSQEFGNKINSFSNWELLNLFRKRTFNEILLKFLSFELEKGFSSPPKTNDEIIRNQFLTETIRELLIFPSNKFHLNVLKSDPKSYERIRKFISDNKYVNWQIPKVLIEYFLNLKIGEIHWQKEDEEYMEECFVEGSASAYNGGSGKLASIQRAIENGIKFIVDNQIIQTNDEYQEWITKKYSSFVDGVLKRNQIQIIEK